MAAERGGRRELSLFVRFCVVGAAGFLADAGVLAALVYVAGAGPFVGRAVSAPLAILFTFVLNRHWAFAGAPTAPFWRSLIAYLGVQATGFVVNLLVYAFAVAVLPAPASQPLVALSFASAVALAVNYAGARLLVFRSSERPAITHPPPSNLR